MTTYDRDEMTALLYDINCGKIDSAIIQSVPYQRLVWMTHLAVKLFARRSQLVVRTALSEFTEDLLVQKQRKTTTKFSKFSDEQLKRLLVLAFETNIYPSREAKQMMSVEVGIPFKDVCVFYCKLRTYVQPYVVDLNKKLPS